MQAAVAPNEPFDAPAQIPTPCTGCGAPMREETSGGQSVLACPFCEQREAMPVEAQQRAAFSRGRL